MKFLIIIHFCQDFPILSQSIATKQILVSDIVDGHLACPLIAVQVMAKWAVEFPRRDTKLHISFAKNVHNQRKFCFLNDA